MITVVRLHKKRIVIVDDVTTTGNSLVQTYRALEKELGKEMFEVVKAIVVLDRSQGKAEKAMRKLGIPFEAILKEEDFNK